MIDLLHPDLMDSVALSAWINRPAAPPHDRRTIDFAGLERLPLMLEQLLHETPRVDATIRLEGRQSHVVH